ncbi:sigma-70 family RNA polymerase sigma factor [Microbulbifer sp. OS29]|uniref:RNA polymerase sigma factor n=1 Tax=Microbulbifer okhotskensis TaxID=2926617 RepID=A0A9X2EQQ3_9GAMM|nr:sigma-70 family RNA polymerase sigma factor [Microbulbifer okhotskensis]MCO1336040.1 sigma-70 family RNA polymerase sigma factor [Microbulbifer okhotskensis]
MAHRTHPNSETNPVKLLQRENQDWSTLLTKVGHERDRQAFEQLFRHFAPLIKGFHHNRTTQAISAEAADELVQETLLKVWRKAPSFDASRASASTWIFTIMRNTRIDMLRRSGRHKSADIIEAVDVWDETPEHQPLIFLQRRRNEREIAESLHSLPTEQSHVLEKAYMEGKSHSEISTELALPLGTVKSRVRLALKKLQARLAK